MRVRIGAWPSGLYFARLRAADGRVGFAPFVVRPFRLGEHPVAVVLPTLTWQAYNLRDENRDGSGDSWYADSDDDDSARTALPEPRRAVQLPALRTARPALACRAPASESTCSPSGISSRFRARQRSPKAYDLIVFPGHHEYVTTREYHLVEGYRDRGGNLAFLYANNYYWQVVRHEGFPHEETAVARLGASGGCPHRRAVPDERSDTPSTVDRADLQRRLPGSSPGPTCRWARG